MPAPNPTSPALTIWQAGVAAVGGAAAVRAALAKAPPPQPDAIIAVGKAASAMAQAALETYPNVGRTLIITKYGHGKDTGVETIEAGHPVPDDNSLKAGARACALRDELGPQSQLMMLVSGGASALAEKPVEGVSLSQMSAATEAMLAQGLDIAAINARRRSLSQIKGGRFLARFRGARATTLAISDVQGDNLMVIGSGIGAAPATREFDFTHHIVASNGVARASAAEAARQLGLNLLSVSEDLYDDVAQCAAGIAARLRAGDAGVHIFGGEPTVVLPDNPGRGGRNQALALHLAREIAGMEGLEIVVAGTDGTDGPTDAAGAVITGATWEPSGAQALASADSGSWLDAKGALLKTGPTGTNVMDLVIAHQA